MADQYLNGCVHANINGSNERDRVNTTLNEMENQLDNYSSYNYATYGPSDHSWAPDVSKASTPDGYLKNFRNKLETAHNNGTITVLDGDAWYVMDSFDYEYGYGDYISSVAIDLDGDGNRESHIGVARSLSVGNAAAYADPNRISASWGIHGLAHQFGVGHGDGGYSINSNGEIHSVTPAATGYMRAGSGQDNPDTCNGTDGNVPSTFCGGQDNYRANYYCGDCQYWCRHKWAMTTCTKDTIVANTPK
jgi:hypothetical protein